MSIELLKNPIGYGRKAISILESQLVNANSSYRKIKLNSKIREWKKFIELMESEANVEESNKTKD